MIIIVASCWTTKERLPCQSKWWKQ